MKTQVFANPIFVGYSQYIKVQRYLVFWQGICTFYDFGYKSSLFGN